MKKIGLDSRIAALKVLDAVLRQGHTLDNAFDLSEQVAGLEVRERAYARNLVTTILRRSGQIDSLIGHCLEKPLGKRGRQAEMLLRIGICQLMFLQTADHAAISTTVDLAQGLGQGPYKKLINAVLRRIQREGPDLIAGQDAPRLNTPRWLWQSWVSAYGEATAYDIAAAHLSESPLDISCKHEPEVWADRLAGELLPWGTVRRAPGGNIRDLPGYADGAWWIQDAAARMTVRLMGDVADKHVIDLCAAPGGKTLYLASAGGRVTAVDRSANRLERLQDNLSRMNLNARIIVADGLTWRPQEPVDMVLLDAPCSATGTLRRHPDVALLKSNDDVVKLAGLQAKLFDTAATMVKPSGMILFCTCSLQPEEGPLQVRGFLERHPEFRLDRIEAPEIFAATNPTGMFRSLPSDVPALGGRDGFFAARVVRQ